jgi:hypothetical protein
MQVLPFFAQRAIDEKATNLILYSDESSLRNAEDLPVADYARDLRATVTVCPGGGNWYSIPYPKQFAPLPEWTRGIQLSAKLIHMMQSLRGYPETLAAVGLNNLAILISCGPEYFFLRCPADQLHAEDMVFTVPIDTARPAFIINVESTIPLFYPPRALGGVAGIAEGIWREEVRKQMALVMTAAPLIVQFPPQGCGLFDIAMSDQQYVQLLRSVERGGEVEIGRAHV